MSRKTRYMRLETDPESSQSSDDDAPPTNIPLHTSQYVKGSFQLSVTINTQAFELYREQVEPY